MGRTNQTYRDQVRGIEEQWSDFRRALRRRDQPHFDHLFEHAREQADAGGYLNHPNPEIPILISIAVEQERRIVELEDRVQA
ncbi:hypothetical protein NDI76_20855 [Halogeometricum sp. S1BR25-6]|uniref:DUF8156 domain-containing protein n=1 Tax=Halogeometricum salsisoli TaxID=2950536 RepID=A0ABU2GK87_9EURY|nr:hypothetical protein [Halogeometricum sp. S1BR25-6]MDS0301190.1 hypothetical protein [Halogeometricum sp. S1BR25-6]